MHHEPLEHYSEIFTYLSLGHSCILSPTYIILLTHTDLSQTSMHSPRHCAFCTSPCTFTPSLNLTPSHPFTPQHLYTTCLNYTLPFCTVKHPLIHRVPIAHAHSSTSSLTYAMPQASSLIYAVSLQHLHRVSLPFPPGSSHLPVRQPGTSNLLPTSPLIFILENWHGTLEMTAFDHGSAEAANDFPKLLGIMAPRFWMHSVSYRTLIQKLLLCDALFCTIESYRHKSFNSILNELHLNQKEPYCPIFIFIYIANSKAENGCFIKLNFRIQHTMRGI